jgi:hypothetical protein
MRTHADRDETESGGDYDVPGGDYDVPGGDYGAPDDYAWNTADSAAYWRRRFFILCGGVVALGVCAWLFPAGHRTPAHPSAAASASMAALQSQQALPPAATGSAWPVPTPAARQSTAPTASPAAPAKPPAAAKQKVSTAYHPRLAGAAGATCAPADIVLSLFTSQSRYTADKRPVFNVYAVSTSAAACTMPYGAGSVQVVVTRQGRVVWDSAACEPSAARPVRFTPGVPQVLSMIWNRAAARPAGCAGTLPADFAGSVDAVATTKGGQSSSVVTVKLERS